jgi:hypothetical protein
MELERPDREDRVRIPGPLITNQILLLLVNYVSGVFCSPSTHLRPRGPISVRPNPYKALIKIFIGLYKAS